MEQRQEKNAAMLKYVKRRFDGGSEIELIRTIEATQMNKMFGHPAQNAQHNFTAPLSLAPVNTPQAQVPAPQPAKRSKREKMLETAIRGPLQICIGLVGILTSSLAIFTFQRANNQPMLAQSKQVLFDCLKTLNKGFWESLTTPVRVLKVALQKQ